MKGLKTLQGPYSNELSRQRLLLLLNHIQRATREVKAFPWCFVLSVCLSDRHFRFTRNRLTLSSRNICRNMWSASVKHYFALISTFRGLFIISWEIFKSDEVRSLHSEAPIGNLSLKIYPIPISAQIKLIIVSILLYF